MANRAGIRANIRRDLDDETTPYTYTDATLNGWINDAIRRYNERTGVEKSTTISGVVGQREYTLPSDFRSVDCVEFPAGEDPRKFAYRLDETHPNFTAGNYYDIRQSTLVLGNKPAAGEDIELYYIGDADQLSNDTTTIEIPDQHLHVIQLYCIAAATISKEMPRTLDPDPSSILLSLLSQTALRAVRRFREALVRVENTPMSSSLSWGLSDRWARAGVGWA